jgi:ABC-type uncharacterized transport system ATPase subunit
MVYQHFTLVPSLTGDENLAISRGSHTPGYSRAGHLPLFGIKDESYDNYI